MKDILDKLIESLESGNVILGFVIIAVAIVFNYRKVVEFVEERKKARIKILNEALDCKYVSGLKESHFKEEISTEHFKVATGIRVERQFREALIELYRAANGELGFIHFKRAFPHIFFENGSVVVRITPFEKVSYVFNYAFGFVLFLSGLLLIALAWYISLGDLSSFLNALLMGGVFVVSAVFMLSQTLSVVSAKKVDKLISREIQRLRGDT